MISKAPTQRINKINTITIDLLTDLEIFKRSFKASATSEIEYRPERKIDSVGQVLNDVIETSLLIAKTVGLKKDEDKMELREINKGINQFKHYLFEGTFGILEIVPFLTAFASTVWM